MTGVGSRPESWSRPSPSAAATPCARRSASPGTDPSSTSCCPGRPRTAVRYRCAGWGLPSPTRSAVCWRRTGPIRARPSARRCAPGGRRAGASCSPTSTATIGYQCVGRPPPLRSGSERGYRRGWDPDQQWQGLIPFDALPALADPPPRVGRQRQQPDRSRRLPLPPWAGPGAAATRARRIRTMIEDDPPLRRVGRPDASAEEFVEMQTDLVSLRAVEALPPLLAALAEAPDPRLAAARSLLGSWDGHMGRRAARRLHLRSVLPPLEPAGRRRTLSRRTRPSCLAWVVTGWRSSC